MALYLNKPESPHQECFVLNLVEISKRRGRVYKRPIKGDQKNLFKLSSQLGEQSYSDNRICKMKIIRHLFKVLKASTLSAIFYQYKERSLMTAAWSRTRPSGIRPGTARR